MPLSAKAKEISSCSNSGTHFACFTLIYVRVCADADVCMRSFIQMIFYLLTKVNEDE